MRTLRPDVKINEDRMKIVALLHDVCKVTRYRWNSENKEYESDYSVMPVGHGEKSVIMLLRMRVELHDDEIMPFAGTWEHGTRLECLKMTRIIPVVYTWMLRMVSQTPYGAKSRVSASAG